MNELEQHLTRLESEIEVVKLKIQIARLEDDNAQLRRMIGVYAQMAHPEMHFTTEDMTDECGRVY